jgi:two-component system, NtrC family, response regulator HydG
LKTVHIEIPPLRRRREAIEPLALFFLQIFNVENGKKTRLHPDALKAMHGYPWPGNIGELKNTIQSLVMQSVRSVILLEDLPERIAEIASPAYKGPFLDLKAELVEEFERKYFVTLLREARGNVSQAARTAQIARINLIQKLKNLCIDPKSFK